MLGDTTSFFKDISLFATNGTKVNSLPTAMSHHGGLSTKFNGSNSYISLGTAPPQITFAYNQPFSISLWAKADATVPPGVFPGLFGCNASANHFQYSIGATNNKFFASVNKSGVGSNSVTALAAFTAGIWYHLVLVFDTVNVSFYINGVSQGSTAYTFGAISNPDGLFAIGQDGTGGADRFFNGDIDGVRCYKLPLISNRITRLYSEPYAGIREEGPRWRVGIPPAPPPSAGWGPLLGGQRNRIVGSLVA